MAADREHQSTEDLRAWGYAPGGYMFRCIDCGPQPVAERPIGAKLSWRCQPCARKAREEAEWQAAQPPLACDMGVPHV